MTNPTIYVGTVGATISILSYADLVTGVASVVITVRKPDGTTATWTPDSVTEAGVITYTLSAGDVDIAGTYGIQPVATMDDGDVWPLGAAEWTVYARFEVV